MKNPSRKKKTWPDYKASIRKWLVRIGLTMCVIYGLGFTIRALSDWVYTGEEVAAGRMEMSRPQRALRALHRGAYVIHVTNVIIVTFVIPRLWYLLIGGTLFQIDDGLVRVIKDGLAKTDSPVATGEINQAVRLYLETKGISKGERFDDVVARVKALGIDDCRVLYPKGLGYRKRPAMFCRQLLMGNLRLSTGRHAGRMKLLIVIEHFGDELTSDVSASVAALSF